MELILTMSAQDCFSISNLVWVVFEELMGLPERDRKGTSCFGYEHPKQNLV